MAATGTKKTTAPRLPSEVFSVEFNQSLVHQALTSYLSNQRQGSVKLKNRSDVRGGGKKDGAKNQSGNGRCLKGYGHERVVANPIECIRNRRSVVVGDQRSPNVGGGEEPERVFRVVFPIQ